MGLKNLISDIVHNAKIKKDGTVRQDEKYETNNVLQHKQKDDQPKQKVREHVDPKTETR